jgi:hypothetical protein
MVQFKQVVIEGMVLSDEVPFVVLRESRAKELLTIPLASMEALSIVQASLREGADMDTFSFSTFAISLAHELHASIKVLFMDVNDKNEPVALILVHRCKEKDDVHVPISIGNGIALAIMLSLDVHVSKELYNLLVRDSFSSKEMSSFSPISIIENGFAHEIENIAYNDLISQLKEKNVEEEKRMPVFNPDSSGRESVVYHSGQIEDPRNFLSGLSKHQFGRFKQ